MLDSDHVIDSLSYIDPPVKNSDLGTVIDDLIQKESHSSVSHDAITTSYSLPPVSSITLSLLHSIRIESSRGNQ